MRNIKLFEDFVKGEAAPEYMGMTSEYILGLTPEEVGLLIWQYPTYQPRAWGMWEAKQPDEFRTLWSKMIEDDRDHGLQPEDARAIGKYIQKPANAKVLADLVALFNRQYPGVDYVQR